MVNLVFQFNSNMSPLSLMSLNFVLYCQRKCDHDVWMKRSLTNTEKAIAIFTLRASLNKLKGTLLEKSVALRELNEVNLGLTVQLQNSDRATRVWMSTAAVLTIILAFIASVYML